MKKATGKKRSDTSGQNIGMVGRKSENLTSRRRPKIYVLVLSVREANSMLAIFQFTYSE